MTWLVVGGNGQLGRCLTSLLADSNIKYQSINSKDLDITSSFQTKTLIDSIRPLVVINTAAWTEVDEAEQNVEKTYAVNVQGVKNLIDASKDFNSVFVQVSTDYVFSRMSSTPLEVTEPYSPVSVYGKSKADGEKVVRDLYPKNSYIFRTAWLYSPYGKNFAKTMIRLALKNKNKIRVVDDQMGQPTSALDFAERIIKSLVADIPKDIYHATNSGLATWNEFAREIFSQIGEDPIRVESISSSELKKSAKRPQYSVLSHKCWENTEMSPMRDWREALAEQIDTIKKSVIEEGL